MKKSLLMCAFTGACLFLAPALAEGPPGPTPASCRKAILNADSSVPKWKHLREHAEFTPRDVAQPFEFKGELWISNGYRDSVTTARDLWKSADGATWTQVNGATPYDAYSGIAAFHGKLYAVKNSVWSSKDGVAWERVLAHGPLEDPDAIPHLRVLGERLLLLWGEQVWSTADGAHWRREPDAPYGARARYAVAATPDAIYVMGGSRKVRSASRTQGDFYPYWRALNDVWRTTDGRTWKQVTAHASWSPRMWPSAVQHEGRLWLVGGFDAPHRANLGDTWVSDDGANWCLVDADSLEARHWPSLFSLPGRLLLVAGNAWPVQNDVWALDAHSEPVRSSAAVSPGPRTAAR